MKNWYTIKAQHERAEIWLYGDIVSERWDETEVSAKSFIDDLNALQIADIDVRINSGGGAVFEAVAIYNALLRHPAQITMHIDGVAASAASLIAMAGDLIVMADTAQMMIHNPWIMMMVAGDAKDVREASERTAALLDSTKEAMINAYARRSKLSREAIAAAMDAETWYTAQKAVDAGFADEIFEGQRIAACIPPGRYKHPPQSLILSGDSPMTTKANSGAPQGAPPIEDNSVRMTATTVAATAVQPDAVNVAEIEAAAQKRALEADRQRRDAIAAVFKPFADKADLCRQCQDDVACTADDASKRLLAELGKSAVPLGGTGPRIETGEDATEKFRRDAVSVLVSRSTHKPIDPQSNLGFLGFRRLAEHCLARAGIDRRKLESMRPNDLMAMAITHSTSDFPLILQDAMHKAIVSNYMAFTDTWRRFCRVGQVSDFRPHNRYKLGSFGDLSSLNELGEYSAGTVPDAEREIQQATTKGKEIRLGRNLLINDDMDVFSRIGEQMGRGAARTVEKDVYALLAANAAMADGVALFHANHANLAGSGAAPSLTTLAAAEDAMRSQTDVGGNEIIDIRPQVFVSGLANARTALETYGSEFTPETTGSRATRRVNALFGRIAGDNIVGTPRITGTEWYLFASPAEAPCVEVAFLDGVTEPAVDTIESRNPDGVRLLVRLDYGVKALDWRGGYKNAGS